MPAKVNSGKSSGADGLDHLEVVEPEVSLDDDVVVLADADVDVLGVVVVLRRLALGQAALPAPGHPRRGHDDDVLRHKFYSFCHLQSFLVFSKKL